MNRVFSELQRNLSFDDLDRRSLERLGPLVRQHSEEMLAHLFSVAERWPSQPLPPDLLPRLRSMVRLLILRLANGPWDDDYIQTQIEAGRRMAELGLPLHSITLAINVIRNELLVLATQLGADALAASTAAMKILDISHAIASEAYRDTTVEDLEARERRERDALARQLRASEARADQIIARSGVLIATLTVDGQIALFNPRCRALTGVSDVELGQRTWYDIFIPTGRHAEVRALVAAALVGEAVRPIEATCAGAAGERLLRWSFTALAGESTVCAIGIDLTDERALTLRTLRAERLASLGSFAASLAHELRNPLNAARLQLTLLQRRLDRVEAGGAREAAALVADELGRLTSLVEDFLRYARPTELRRSVGDLRATVGAVLSLLQPEADGLTVALAATPGPPVPATYDDERMRQVIHNLVRNSLEATEAGGHVRVSVSREGQVAIIAVEDDGRGIPSPSTPVFDPFFTLKQGGTGLGLAIVQRIVSAHEGEVSFSSQPGQTVFTVRIPAE